MGCWQVFDSSPHQSCLSTAWYCKVIVQQFTDTHATLEFIAILHNLMGCLPSKKKKVGEFSCQNSGNFHMAELSPGLDTVYTMWRISSGAPKW